MRLRACSPVASSSILARSAKASIPKPENRSYAKRSCSRASRRGARRSHSPYRRWGTREIDSDSGSTEPVDRLDVPIPPASPQGGEHLRAAERMAFSGPSRLRLRVLCFQVRGPDRFDAATFRTIKNTLTAATAPRSATPGSLGPGGGPPRGPRLPPRRMRALVPRSRWHDRASVRQPPGEQRPGRIRRSRRGRAARQRPEERPSPARAGLRVRPRTR